MKPLNPAVEIPHSLACPVRPVAIVSLSSTLHDAHRLAFWLGCDVRIDSRGRRA